MPKVFSDSGITIIPPNPPLEKGGTIENCWESPPLKKGDLRASKGKEFMANAIERLGHQKIILKKTGFPGRWPREAGWLCKDGARCAPYAKHRRDACATQNLPMKISDRGGGQCPPYDKPPKSFSPFRFFISFPSFCLGTHISAKLRLAIGISPPGLPAFLSKADLCIKAGSQAGAWEPENARRYVFVFRHLA